MRSGLKNKTKILEEVILRKKDNIIYVDFVLYSMTTAIEKWYNEYYQYDKYGTYKKSHMTHLVRFYDHKRFSYHKTLGEERDKYLTEIDLYVQMKRDD